MAPSFLRPAERPSTQPVELNRLLLEEAAFLAAATVRWLARNAATERQRDTIDAGTAARAAVDLLVWSKVSSLDGDSDDETAYEQNGRIDLPVTVAQRVADSGGEFADTAIVPCLNATQDGTHSIEPIAWCPPRAARFWVDVSETFTVACLADHGRSLGIAPLWPGLGEERAKRLGRISEYARAARVPGTSGAL